MRTISLISVFLLSLCSFNTFAANSFYFVGLAGQEQSVTTPKYSSALVIEDFIDVTYQTESEGSPYRLFAGYQFNELLSLETGYTDYEKQRFSMVSFSDESDINISGESKSTSLDLVGTLTIPFTNQFALKAKLGMVIWENKTDLILGTYATPYTEQDSTLKTSLLSGLGASFALNSRLSLSLDWDNRSIYGRNVESIGLSLALRL